MTDRTSISGGAPGFARWRVAALVALAAPLVVAADARAAEWQLSVRSDRHSDAMPLADYGDDRYDRLRPRQGRNLTYVEDEVRASVRTGRSTWSLLARNSGTLVANRDALELLAQLEHAAPTDRDRAWRTHARLRAYTGTGLEAAHTFMLAPSLRATASVQALSLQRWRERTFEGPVDYTAASGTYAFDLQSHEASSRLRFPFQRPYAGRGFGLLFGAGLQWQLDRLSLEVSMRDAGWLRWRGLPEEEARLSSTTRDVDDEGFVLYRPLVQGRHRQDGLTVRRAPRADLQAWWTVAEGMRAGAALDAVPGFGVLPRVGWRQPVGPVALGVDWRFHERRATLALSWKGLAMQLGTDGVGGDRRSQDIALSASFTF